MSDFKLDINRCQSATETIRRAKAFPPWNAFFVFKENVFEH